MRIMNVVGHIVHERTSAETIRDTYGDYIVDATGARVHTSSLPCLAAPNAGGRRNRAEALGIVLRHGRRRARRHHPVPGRRHRSKRRSCSSSRTISVFPNARPGGCDRPFFPDGSGHHLLPRPTNERRAGRWNFTAPCSPVLQDKLKERERPKEARHGHRKGDGVSRCPADAERQLGELLGPINGRNNWETLVQFMSGKRPDQCTERRRGTPSSRQVRNVWPSCTKAWMPCAKSARFLAPPTPRKAQAGTIRKEFGQTIMINAAHASDAKENAVREMKIIRIEENNFRTLIEDAYRG